ncbi:MAG: TonB-dependent receptor [Terracidiphilus sp.]|nr:TonB-dependent receptor [Terracidiphilus sp.]
MQSRLLKVSRFLLLALFGIVLLTVNNQCFGQDTNASLSGTVSDPTGAVIPGAKLALTNQATGFQATFVSSPSGEFTFRNMTPGKYNLAATAPGFKSSTQKGIELAVNQAARVDVHLPLGNTDETVEVIGDASLINYENPTLEGGVSPEVLQDFPLVVSGAPRSSVAVAIMMPGVTTGGGGNAFNARINGGIVTGDEALVDGATATEGYMNQSGMVSLQTDFGMSPDITSEVKVLTSNYDAQYGSSTSGQIIIETKSGGEKFHGAGYEYLRNDYFNAFQYGTAKTTKKPADKENDYGANVGGPIYIPGFHGPNSFLKGYFYFNWEGFKDHGGANSATLSVASAKARAGDFSGWTSQLYYPNDPVKYGALAGAAIPNNKIDSKFEDPIAKAWLAALPTPTNSAEVNNYFVPVSGQGSLTSSENVYFARADLNVGNKDHLYYTYWWQYSGVNAASNLPKAISTAEPADTENAPIQRLNWEHTFSDVMTNHLTLGYLNRNEDYYSLNSGSSLPTVTGVANSAYLPTFTFSGPGSYSQLGDAKGPSGANLTTRGTYAVNDVLTRVIGKHTLKAGYEWHLAGTTIHNAGSGNGGQGGTFTFSADTTGNTGCAGSSCPGSEMASLYLGAASAAKVAYMNVLAEYPRQSAYAAHLGDTWRVNPKLTLSYSLRWDYIAPFKEKYNNLSFFDPTGSNPGAVTSAGVQLKGRLAFAGNGFGAASYGADYPETPFKSALAPRIGLAYTVNDKTVVRAGYGIYFGQAFYPGWAGGMSQDGFNKTLNLSESTSGNFKVPALYLNSGITAAQVGTTKHIDSAFDNGTAPSLYRPLDGNKRPYSSQWNLTIERQLPSSFFASVSYVGTKGTHLPSALSPLNILNPNNPTVSAIGNDLSVSYNDANGPATFAAHKVNVPYVGWASQMTGCAPTIAQALAPYPMYCGVLQGLNEQHANSFYNSIQGRVERHFKDGLYILGSLSVQKLFTNASDSTQSGNDIGAGNQGNNGQFSPFNEARAWAIAPDNVPLTGSLAIVYDLPLGAKKRFLNTPGVMNALVGGWQVSPIGRYEFGSPMSFDSSSCPVSSNVPQFREGCVPGILPGQKVQLHGRNGFNPATTSNYLNLSAFETDFSSFGYTGYGKAVTTVYGPAYKNIDMSLTKNTKIFEKVNFKFTANFFNALNQHALINSQGGNYGGPSVAFTTDVASSSFGTWNKAVSTPRTIQFAGRIEF